MADFYDVIIIGAGPIGLACAVEAQRKNKSYLVFDKGCIVNSIFGYPYYMHFFSTGNLLEIGSIPFITQSPKPTRFDALEYYRRVTLAYQLNIRPFEAVTHVEGEEGHFQVITAKGTYACAKVITAIGYFDFPRMLGVPGEDAPHVSHYYKEPHLYLSTDLLIIGSGNSAVEAALETHRHGANVTLCIRGPELKNGVKYWIRPDIDNRIKNKEIKAFFQTQVLEIQPSQVILQTGDQEPFAYPANRVLALTGYHPDFDFLRRIGVTIGSDPYRTPVCDPKTYETNRKGLYLAGVVVGGLRTDLWFIENSRDHAKAIFLHLESA